MTLTQVSRSSGLIWILLVAVLTTLLYLPSLNGTFVYDDQLDVLENPIIHDLKNAPSYLSLSAMRQGLYDGVRPVYVVAMMTEWALWGPKAFGYHLTNLLLHVLNTLLLFFWIRHLLLLRAPEKERWAAACAAAGALLFAMHPLASEAVCPVTFCKDLLVSFFTLLALNALVCFSGHGGSKGFWGASVVLALLLAVGSKETGIVGPYLVLLYWFLFRREDPRRAWVWLLGAAFLAVHAFIAFRLLVPNNAGTIDPHYVGGSFGKMFLMQPRIWAYQLSQVFLPAWARFCADPFNLALDAFSRNGGIVVTLLALALAVWAGTKDKIVLFGAALYALALLPVSNLLPIPQVIADRFLYLPLAGMAILMGALLFRFLPQWGRRAQAASTAVLLLILAFLGVQTLDRERAWHDDLSVWADTLAKNPRSLNAMMGQAGALYVNGDFAGALHGYALVVQKTRGTFVDAWAGLASSLDAMGRAPEADKAFNELLRLDPRYLRPELYDKRALRLSEQDMRDFQRLAKRHKPKA